MGVLIFPSASFFSSSCLGCRMVLQDCRTLACSLSLSLSLSLIFSLAWGSPPTESRQEIQKVRAQCDSNRTFGFECGVRTFRYGTRSAPQSGSEISSKEPESAIFGVESETGMSDMEPESSFCGMEQKSTISGMETRILTCQYGPRSSCHGY